MSGFGMLRRRVFCFGALMLVLLFCVAPRGMAQGTNECWGGYHVGTLCPNTCEPCGKCDACGCSCVADTHYGTACPGNCDGVPCTKCSKCGCTCRPTVHIVNPADCICDRCDGSCCVPDGNGICKNCGDPPPDDWWEHLEDCYGEWQVRNPGSDLDFDKWYVMQASYDPDSGVSYDKWISGTVTYEDLVKYWVGMAWEKFLTLSKLVARMVEASRDPINVLSGELYFTESDVSVPSPGIPLMLERYYSSDDGWRHTYGWKFKAIKNDASSSRSVHVLPDYDIWAGLQAEVFTNSTEALEDLGHLLVKTGQGADYRFEESETEPGAFYSEAVNWKVAFGPLVENGETNGYQFVLHQPGGIAYTFRSDQLESIEDGWGNRVDLTYSSNSLLVAHSCGSSLLLEHEGDPKHPTRAYVSADLYVDYAYDERGSLTNTVRHVDGETFEFTYQYDADGVMTNKVNPRGDEYCFTQTLSASGGDTNRTTTLEIGDGWMKHEVDAHWGIASGEKFRYSDVVYDYGNGLEKKYRYETTNEMIRVAYGPYTNVAEKLETGIEYTYDRKNVATEKTFDAPLGESFTVHKQYDTNNHVTAIGVSYNSTSPVWQAHIGYDSEWLLPSAITNAEGHWTQTTYTNGSPRAIKAFWADTQSFNTTFGYYTNGLVASVTNANLHVTEMEYDSSGNPSLAWAELGPQMATTFNALGHLERSETLAENGSGTGRVTEYDVTSKGWIKSVTHPDDSQTTFARDNAGNVTNTVDRAGRKTDFTYAPTKKLTSVTRYLSEGGTNTPVKISYAFDKMFNSLSITNPSTDAVETYQLDLQDRVTEATNIEGQTMDIEYFVGDFVRKVVRFDESIITNSYDQAGRLNHVAYCTAGFQPAASVAYSYYPDGEIKTIADGTSSITNSYDRLNRLTNSTLSSLCSFAVNNQYDSVGSVTNTVVSTGGAQVSETAYTYDAAERLSSISTDSTFLYEYNTDNGRIASVSNTVSGITCSYEFDLMDRATNITYRASDGSLIRSLEYEYDAASMITEKKIVDDASSFVRHSYIYDSLDRLVRESGSASSASSAVYKYDLAGNRTTKTSKGWKTAYTLGDGNRLASTSAQAATNSLFVSGSANELIGTDERWGELWITNWTSGAGSIPSVNGHGFFAEILATPDQTNTLHVAIPDRAGNMGYATTDIYAPSAGGAPSTSSYSYNEAGCLTNLNGVSLEWDERYRLKNVDGASSSVAYKYDVLNRRASRTAIAGGITNVEHYVYTGQQVAADLDGSGNLLRTYVWGTGIDNLLAMTVYGGTVTNTYYAIKDHQNTVIALVDETGSVVESYEYNAWGNTKVFDANGTELPMSGIGNHYMWQGREYDSTTGLYYFRARWYDSESGRFISKDPVGISGGLNLYVFCANNPVNFVDPSGLCQKGLRDGDAILEFYRDLFDSMDDYAKENWWATDAAMEYWAILGLNGGYRGSPFDFKYSENNRSFKVGGQVMAPDVFGNYVAGYAAGYGDSVGLYISVRLGGVYHAIKGGDESWNDSESVSDINAGYSAGRAAQAGR